jgi:acyl transferase domain-containing protein
VDWGIRPALMFGYSLGEYAAACLAGVLSLPDAIALVSHRAALIGQAEPGAMAAVPLGDEELRERFSVESRRLDIAAVTGPASCVVAGPQAALDDLAAELRAHDVPCRPLETTHAFHSRMLDPLRDRLTEWISRNVELRPPSIPYLSNVTGKVVDAALARDPGYWARHMCSPVQFAAAASALIADEQLAVVEIGPGQSLGALLRGAGCPPQRWPLITSALPAAADPRADDAVIADCLARLWLLGIEIDWEAYHGRTAGAPGAPGRVPLPTYPFQRQPYWIEPSSAAPRATAPAALPSHRSPSGMAPSDTPVPSDALARFDAIPLLPEEQWIFLPVWRQAAAPPTGRPQGRSWLVYAAGGMAGDVLAELRRDAQAAGASLTVAWPGEAYKATRDGYVIRPGNFDDALRMLRGLRSAQALPNRVIHLWTLTDADPDLGSRTGQGSGSGGPDEAGTLLLGLHSLVALAKATSELGMDQWSLDIVAAGAHAVLSGQEVSPAASALTGPALVIPMEYPRVTVRLVDADPGTAGRAGTTAADVAAELRRPATSRTVALRGRRRWLPGYEMVSPVPADQAATVLREQGVYLITGGLGGIALGMARQLAQDCRARLVLFGRTGLPPRHTWAAIRAGAHAVPDYVRDRVTQVLELTELGAEVEIVVGDVAREQDVRQAVAVTHERFGALHGVLHTAGVPGTGLMQFKMPGDGEKVLAPKVDGTGALAAALRLGQPDEVPVDFLVLFSSITSVTGGGPGQVDYCAANAYLDAFAAARWTPRRPVISVAWGEWTWNAWDDGLAGYDEGVARFFRQHRARFGIGFEQGWRTLLRAIASGELNVVISTQDLPSVVKLATGFTVEAVTSLAPAPGDPGRHPRPELVTPYQEPDGETQQAVAGAWGQALRLDRVGAADNFFELGGTSLLGISLLATLRRIFPHADLPPHVIHEAPTVAALAQVIDRAESEPDRDSAVQGQARRSGLRATAARRRRQPSGVAADPSGN